jgi:hypothetical protein
MLPGRRLYQRGWRTAQEMVCPAPPVVVIGWYVPLI